MNSSEVLATLCTLEMKGIVRQLPGKQFTKVLVEELPRELRERFVATMRVSRRECERDERWRYTMVVHIHIKVEKVKNWRKVYQEKAVMVARRTQAAR